MAMWMCALPGRCSAWGPQHRPTCGVRPPPYYHPTNLRHAVQCSRHTDTLNITCGACWCSVFMHALALLLPTIAAPHRFHRARQRRPSAAGSASLGVLRAHQQSRGGALPHQHHGTVPGSWTPPVCVGWQSHGRTGRWCESFPCTNTGEIAQHAACTHNSTTQQQHAETSQRSIKSGMAEAAAYTLRQRKGSAPEAHAHQV